MKTPPIFYILALCALLFTACQKESKEKPQNPIPVTGVSLNINELTLVPGDSTTLIVTVQPDNATNKTVTWTSSNPEAATVTVTGKITAVIDGEATITATTHDGGKTDSCVVSVKKNLIHVTGVSLNTNELTLVAGDTETLTATVQPDDATNKTVTWTSSNPEAATVTDDGLGTAIAKGTAIITATTQDGGKTASCVVTVTAAPISVTGVSLNTPELILSPGYTTTLTANVQPDNATNKTVTWKSSNTDIATVTENGFVTAIADGKTTITATSQDGGKTATCIVNVDYRNKWVGDWDFTTIDYVHYYLDILDPESLVIIQDTVRFIGTIKKSGYYDKLKIIFKPNASEPDLGNYFPLKINGLLYPTIDDSGNLTIIGWDYRPYFQGFISNNEISISYGMAGPLGMAAYENHKIQGTKIK